MCFSATASFSAGAVLAGIGAVSLTQMRAPQEFGIAALPLAFAAHQTAEGLVWLSATGRAPAAVGHAAAAAYLAWAHALLPLVAPLIVWWFVAERRRLLTPLLVIGAGLSLYIATTLLRFDWGVEVVASSLNYRNPGLGWLAAVVYAIATLGPFLVSGRRWLVAFGVVNLIGLVATIAVKAYAFTSIWCFVAAMSSVFVLGAMRRQHRAQPV